MESVKKEMTGQEMFDILSVNCFYYNYDIPAAHICDMEFPKPANCSISECPLLRKEK
jgi:hypothetical protein